MKDKIVYICSRFSGESQEEGRINVEFAKLVSGIVASAGYVPMAPHLLFPQFLDDNVPGERDLAMQMNEVLLRRCDILFVANREISNGMAKEIKLAEEHGIPIIHSVMELIGGVK